MAQIYGYIRTSRQLQEGAPGMASRSSSASVPTWEYAPLPDEAVLRRVRGILRTPDFFLFFDLPVLAMFSSPKVIQ